MATHMATPETKGFPMESTSTKTFRYDFSEEVNLDHPLSLRRVPVVRSPHLRFKYHVAVAVGPEEWDWVTPGEEPTELEANQLVAYLDFRLRWYNDQYRQHMLEAHAFDLDSGINTYTFKKCPEVGWQYNAATWTMHRWFPQNRVHDERFDSLEALLDYVQNILPEKWASFKAENPALWSLTTPATDHRGDPSAGSEGER